MSLNRILNHALMRKQSVTASILIAIITFYNPGMGIFLITAFAITMVIHRYYASNLLPSLAETVSMTNLKHDSKACVLNYRNIQQHLLDNPHDLVQHQVMPEVAVPTQTPMLNRQAAEKYIAVINSLELQTFARKFILGDTFITYVSYGELQLRLQACMWYLQGLLRTHQSQPNESFLLTEQHHSHSWIAALAKPYLPFIPLHELTLNQSSLELSKVQAVLPVMRNLFIFDDWSISGRQLAAILEEIIQAHYQAKQQFALQVIIISVMMTKFSFGIICDLINNINYSYADKLQFHLITTTYLPSLADLPLNKDEQRLLTRLCYGKEDVDDSWTKRRVFAISDWKVPDDMSQPPCFSRGVLPYQNDRYTDQLISDIPLEALPPQTEFMPTVTPPYMS